MVTCSAQRIKLRFSIIVLACGLAALPRPARAQAEWSRWYFGNLAGLRFTPDSAVVLPDSRMESVAACATISDSAGRLLLYSNARRIWNGRHQVLVNGIRLGGDSLSSQGCALVPIPRRRGVYYLFTLDAWFTPQRRGLRVAEVDVNAAGGRGSVLSLNQPVVPDTLLQRLGNRDFMEMQGLVRHANGRDLWLVTHLLDTNLFLSVLVTGNGFPRSAVVVSAAGMVRTLQPGNANSLPDAPGSIAVAPNGRRIALISQILGAEVFDFDPATGRVANPIRLGWGIYSAGVAFSPDGNLLYISRHEPGQGAGNGCVLNAVSQVRQYDLRLPTPAAVAASGVVVYVGCGRQVWGMQRAPNGRIYAAGLRGGDVTQLTNALDAINRPNVRGVGCQYTPASLSLGANRYPNRHFPVVPNEPPQSRLGTLQIPASVCVGQPVAFGLSGPSLGAPGDTLDWSFGDGTTLRTSVPQVTHTYATVGTFQLFVSLRNRRLSAAEFGRATVRVAARPALNLGPDLRLCVGTPGQLTVGPLASGTTVRWHDGSTAPTRVASAAGLYWAEITSAAGCTARDSVLVTSLLTPRLVLAANQPLCGGGSVMLSPGAQPAGCRYRWQDGSTGASFSAAVPGIYSVTVTAADGCESQADLVLRYGEDCPYQVPDIITPNGDYLNDFFVLKGLNASEWHIQIFSRWGQSVYSKASYDNSWNAAGTPNGVYFYRLHNPATGQQHKGQVEVKR